MGDKPIKTNSHAPFDTKHAGTDPRSGEAEILQRYWHVLNMLPVQKEWSHAARSPAAGRTHLETRACSQELPLRERPMGPSLKRKSAVRHAAYPLNSRHKKTSHIGCPWTGLRHGTFEKHNIPHPPKPCKLFKVATFSCHFRTFFVCANLHTNIPVESLVPR